MWIYVSPSHTDVLVKNWMILMELSFTACMPMSTSTFILVKKQLVTVSYAVSVPSCSHSHTVIQSKHLYSPVIDGKSKLFHSHSHSHSPLFMVNQTLVMVHLLTFLLYLDDNTATRTATARI